MEHSGSHLIRVD